MCGYTCWLLCLKLDLLNLAAVFILEICAVFSPTIVIWWHVILSSTILNRVLGIMLLVSFVLFACCPERSQGEDWDWAWCMHHTSGLAQCFPETTQSCCPGHIECQSSTPLYFILLVAETWKYHITLLILAFFNIMRLYHFKFFFGLYDIFQSIHENGNTSLLLNSNYWYANLSVYDVLPLS
jgi:hypothetical protein